VQDQTPEDRARNSVWRAGAILDGSGPDPTLTIENGIATIGFTLAPDTAAAALIIQPPTESSVFQDANAIDETITLTLAPANAAARAYDLLPATYTFTFADDDEAPAPDPEPETEPETPATPTLRAASITGSAPTTIFTPTRDANDYITATTVTEGTANSAEVNINLEFTPPTSEARFTANFLGKSVDFTDDWSTGVTVTTRDGQTTAMPTVDIALVNSIQFTLPPNATAATLTITPPSASGTFQDDDMTNESVTINLSPQNSAAIAYGTHPAIVITFAEADQPTPPANGAPVP